MNNLLAQATEYRLLAPLPGIETEAGSGVATFATYIPGVFTFAIGIAGVLAVIMIIVGGIEYMSTDAFQGKNNAKNKITNALGGLLLTLSAWLILYTVNPNLIDFNLDIKKIEIKSSAEGGVGGGIGGAIPPIDPLYSFALTQQQAMEVFNLANVTIAGPINLAGIKKGIVDEIVRLKNACGCTVVITSATGGSHSSGSCSHANGYKVDLRNKGGGIPLTNYIQTNYQKLPVSRSDGATVYKSPTGILYALESNHWDVGCTM